VHHGQVGIERHGALEAAQAAVLGPVERALNTGRLPPLPALVGPELRAPVAAVLDECEVGAVRDRRAVDLEGRHVHRVLGTLVVVCELGVWLAERERPRVDEHRAGLLAEPLRRKRAALRRVGTRLRELERLQHRLVVLVLVLDDHFPDGPHASHEIEHLERAGTRTDHELERLSPPQIGKVAAIRTGRLGSVVHDREIRVKRRHAPRSLREPEVLERGDVAEVPDERAHQRVVDAMKVLVAHALDERERPPARFSKQLADVGGEQ
jgi:hypothetical protein